jgi:hypothetical protein
MNFFIRLKKKLGIFFGIGIFLSTGVISLAVTPGEFKKANLSENHRSLTLALKFVEFIHPDGTPVLGVDKADAIAQELARLFSVCNIQFRLEQYFAVRPSDYGLSYRVAAVSDMRRIRQSFDDPRHLVIIDTGGWDHLKMGAPNAWTAMPGDSPSGAVVEGSVVTFAGIVAHELGHYLSLNHVQNSHNLMNPIIYRTSTELTPDQCMSVRTTAMKYRSAAVRST